MRLQMFLAVALFDLLVIAGLIWVMRRGLPLLLVIVPAVLVLSFSGLALVFAWRSPR